MSISDTITIIGTIITVGSMAVTIYYAQKTKKYKEQIQFDIRKINLSNIVEKLKRTQDEIRNLPKNGTKKRGLKVEDIITTIKIHFDFVLNLLDSDGPDNDIREYLATAQNILNDYEDEYISGEIDGEKVLNLTKQLQDVISKANTKIFKIEKDLINE